MPGASIVPSERIDGAILYVRGQRILLDEQLACLYGVETKILNQSVGRNRERFPDDFMFRLTKREMDFILKSQIVTSSDEKQLNSQENNDMLKSQIVTSSRNWGGRRKLPHAFTEQGIAMLSSVLRSPRAIAVNIEIMRAFVRLRQLIATNADLAKKLEALEQKYDARFKIVFDAIRALMKPVTPADKKREIGFHATLNPAPAAPHGKKPAAIRRRPAAALPAA
jgi:hypothetical protein